MAYAIGALLAIAVGAFALLVGLDRDRAFYPTVLIVVASLYALFAIMAGGDALGWELIFLALFTALATIGFRTSLWLVAAGLVGHGLFDFLRGDLIVNAGVPAWWPAFCGAYDVAAGAWLAWLLVRRSPARIAAA